MKELMSHLFVSKILAVSPSGFHVHAIYLSKCTGSGLPVLGRHH